MGVKNIISKAVSKGADKVAELSKLSPKQIEDVQHRRDEYLGEMLKENPSSEDNLELAARLLAANSVEVFNSFLPQMKQLYVPVDNRAEYGAAGEGDDAGLFDEAHNIRFLKISKWVTTKNEDALDKLVSVYEVLSGESCNIALVFHRSMRDVSAYIAVSNTKNADDNNDANDFCKRLADAVRGNFPGSKLEKAGAGRIPCLNNSKPWSVACASNIPTEKSEKFSAQTIEKLLDGVVPADDREEYTLILLATPILDIENRKLHLADYYSGLAPYAQWQTNYTFTESSSNASMATFGVNVGASAGIQNGQSQGDTVSEGSSTTESESVSESETEGQTDSQSYTESRNITHSESSGTTHTESESITDSASAGVSASGSVELFGTGVQGGGYLSLSLSTSKSSSDSISQTIADSLSNGTSEAVSKALSKSTGRSIAQSLGRAVSSTVAKTAGAFSSTSLGMNVGANFARSSTTNIAIGKNEGITQSFANYNVKHALDLLEEQMKRMEQSAALGMWEFAAYVLSEDANTANNVAHTYLALTQGEKSYMSQAAVNLWRGDPASSEEGRQAREICSYLRDLRHPVFGLNPGITDVQPYFNVYPAVVSATTSLTGRELAYALNFPKKSLPGLPVLACAEFGRNVVTYDAPTQGERHLKLGKVFHMYSEERSSVLLAKDSLASHVFVTGSTGSGKSNTVCQILSEAERLGVGFLVVEPAKGEYKDLLSARGGVEVFGTNPRLTPLLRLNPFSFPEGVHALEHLDRLIEIFNVCWPMYAAMSAVLKRAVERSYADCGWDLLRSSNPFGDDLWPTFADVARNVKASIDESEYDAENKGAYKGSLLTRLESLTNGINGMVFACDEVPPEVLFDGRTVVDLSRVGSSETKSLLMGMLVLKLQEHRMTSSSAPNSGLRHLTVLEEAHNLLKRTSFEQPVEGGNLVGKSVEMISNAIAEMRTYGEGFVIADQAPGLLDMAAIRNTNTKIIMRLPDLGDRELAGRAANLDDEQIAELAKLPRGVAAVYQNEWIQPVLCKVRLFDAAGGRYAYVPEEDGGDALDSALAAEVAKLVSSGVKLGKEVLLNDIRPKLRGLGVDASVQVSILRLLASPPKEPRMTRVAPIMTALFPSVSASLADTYTVTCDPRRWTEAVEQALDECVGREIDQSVRRDIVQGIVTDYVLNRLGKVDELKRWSVEGGLR